MALIPLGSGRFADDPDTRLGVNAMRPQNSVFPGVLKHLPWGEFDRLVATHRADSRVRRLTTKSQLVALLYGQLAGAASLREIVTGLQSHRARLYHLGARPVQRSTLADANAHRPAEVFHRAVCADGPPRQPAFAPGSGRYGLSDRFDRPQARSAPRRVGALLRCGEKSQHLFLVDRLCQRVPHTGIV
jgi:hypothetical protein